MPHTFDCVKHYRETLSEPVELPLLPDFIAKLVEDYLPGARVSKGMKLTIPSAQYWNHVLLPSEREQTLQLVGWLGLDRDDFVEMIKRHTPGKPSEIRPNFKP